MTNKETAKRKYMWHILGTLGCTNEYEAHQTIRYLSETEQLKTSPPITLAVSEFLHYSV